MKYTTGWSWIYFALYMVALGWMIYSHEKEDVSGVIIFGVITLICYSNFRDEVQNIRREANLKEILDLKKELQ